MGISVESVPTSKHDICRIIIYIIFIAHVRQGSSSQSLLVAKDTKKWKIEMILPPLIVAILNQSYWCLNYRNIFFYKIIIIKHIF